MNIQYDKYYGCENPESISYLEFGSINIVKGDKKIWNYWQDQTAYDLYMFAFRKLFVFDESIKTIETLNKYMKNAAHNKLLDYIFKYAGMLAINTRGGMRERKLSVWLDRGSQGVRKC
jgi:hypothetical protein